MTETEALAKMYAPGQVRPNKPYRGGVIQIQVTRACDKSCFGCTTGSQLAGKPIFMTPEHFEKAVKSLEGYFGVYGLFGGNPAVSPHFADYCRILRECVPYEQRGIWCNNPLGKGKAMRETFNPSVSNLNVHLDERAYTEFKRDWPESMPVGLTTDSRHSPPYVALKDVLADEGERWELISNCDINRYWSASIILFRGELRAFFCEMAGNMASLHADDPDYPDTGLDPTFRYSWDGQQLWACPPGDESAWWELTMPAFADQVRKHCHECGVPLRGYGELSQTPDLDAKEQVSATHESVFVPKRKGRRVELVTVREQLGRQLKKMTDYLGNARR